MTSNLTLAGRTFALAYDFNLIAEAEEEAGCNLLEALVNLNDLTAMQLRGLLFAAIVVPVTDPPTPHPSILEVGALMDVDTIGPITKALAIAYNLVPPEPAAPCPVLVPEPQGHPSATADGEGLVSGGK